MRSTLPLCLASTSPRRREMLAQYGLEMTLHAPDIAETRQPGEAPEVFVARMAAEKAAAAHAHFPGHLILAGDTIVVLGEEILGKPGNGETAAGMLTRLSGHTHLVMSAYCLLHGPTGQEVGETVRTSVTFRHLSPDWIAWYSAREESWDKAGAYGIQGMGAAMIDRIDGSYANVVGLPIERVFWSMKEQGWLTIG